MNEIPALLLYMAGQRNPPVFSRRVSPGAFVIAGKAAPAASLLYRIFMLPAIVISILFLLGCPGCNRVF